MAYFILVSRNPNNLHVLRTTTKTSLRVANILIYVRISKSREHDRGMLTATSRRPSESYSQLLNRLRCRPEESGLISGKGTRYIHFAIALKLALGPTRTRGYRRIFHRDKISGAQSSKLSFIVTSLGMRGAVHPPLHLHSELLT